METDQTPAPTRRRYLGKSDIVCGAILTALRNGADIGTAAEIVGVARSTVRHWRKADAEFDRAVNEAKLAGVAKVVSDRLMAVNVDPRG